jgi:hypothetical protein
MCFGTQVFAQKYIERALDVKSGLSFSKNSDFGIMMTNNTGTVKVSVFEKDSYEEGDNGSSDSFMYGFESGDNTNTYENIPFGINGRNAWWCILGHCSSNFYYDDYEEKVYDSSNSLKVFRRAIKAKRIYTKTFDNESDGAFYSLSGGKIDVVIEISLIYGATLADIRSIKIPGMEPIENDIESRIEVYRGNNIIPVKTIKFSNFTTSNLDVYEGDSIVFRSPGTDIPFKVFGLTDVAIARWAGESIFMTEEDLGSNTHKPFLFFDSNVHGVKMRTYPESWKGKEKYPRWENKTELSTKVHSKYWIANRRRDHFITYPGQNHNNVSLSAYKTAAEFNQKGFANQNKFSDDNELLSIQRNNQKEGLNVELLDAHEEGLLGVAGLDPDELIYKAFDRSKIVGDPAASRKEFTYVTKDRWKEIKQTDSHINATLIKSFGRIRKFIGNNNNLTYKGHEILDKNLFVNKNADEIIDGKVFNYRVPTPMFNNKTPIVFNPLRTNKPLVHGKSELSWQIGTDTKIINIAVLSPLEGKRNNRNYDNLTQAMRKSPQVNFYGIIEGPTFVARNQENVRYSVTDLPTSTEVPGRFELVYSYEDSNGFLTEKRKIVANNDNYIEITFGGGGYHEITLQYKRNKDENATPVIIAGKELIDVDLRFIFSPDAKDGNDFSYNPGATFGDHHSDNFVGVERLFENKGSGRRWFLDNMNPLMKENNYGLNHGYKDHNVVRTYVLNDQQSLTLSVLDADPHNFTHYQPDWYLSERRLSKRVTDNDLKKPNGQHKIEWFASKNVNFTSAKSLGFGKHKNISPRAIYTVDHSLIYVKAVYNNTSEIRVKFKVRDVAQTPQQMLAANQHVGMVNSYPLSETQFTVFNLMANGSQISTDINNFRIFAVQDLMSTYEYNKDNGPRYKEIVNGASVEVGEHKRFSPKNNFDARFNMSFKKTTTGSAINFSTISYDFTNATDPKLDTWFPDNWIRHLDGKPQSPEIPNFSHASYIKAFDENSDPYIASLNNSQEALYEPWQVRLPWIAQTGLHGYKTRWNIKTIFDIKKLFNRDQVGKAYRVANHTTTSYQNVVNGLSGIKIIPGYNDKRREMQEFFWHLKTGRMVIIDIAKLKNANINRPYVYVRVTNNKKGESDGKLIFKGYVFTNSTNTAARTLNLKETAISKTDFSIYPNPINDGRFSLEFGLKEKGLASFEIFNIAGQLMFQKKNQKLDQGNHKIEFGKSDVNLASGVYLLKVVTNEFTETRKLFVE